MRIEGKRKHDKPPIRLTYVRHKLRQGRLRNSDLRAANLLWGVVIHKLLVSGGKMNKLVMGREGNKRARRELEKVSLADFLVVSESYSSGRDCKSLEHTTISCNRCLVFLNKNSLNENFPFKFSWVLSKHSSFTLFHISLMMSKHTPVVYMTIYDDVISELRSWNSQSFWSDIFPNTGAINDCLVEGEKLAQYFLAILNLSEEYKKWSKFSQNEIVKPLADHRSERSSDVKIEGKRRRQYPTDHTQVSTQHFLWCKNLKLYEFCHFVSTLTAVRAILVCHSIL